MIADKLLIEEINNKDNVEIVFEINITELILKEDKIIGVKTNKNIDYELDGVFINIGYEPSVNILKSLNLNMDKSYIIVDKNMETNLKGIYACGDIIKQDLYQLVTAVSDGAIAANHIAKTYKRDF